MDSNIEPKWAKELRRFIAVKPQFICWGNIFDVYPKEMSGTIITHTFEDYLSHILQDEGYHCVIKYEPIFGFSIIHGDPNVIKNALGESINDGMRASLTKASELIDRGVNNKDTSIAFLIPFGSRLPEISKQEIDEFYYYMFHLCQTSHPYLFPGDNFPKYNAIIWILDKENDLPAWYTVENPRIKILSIPKPDFPVRKMIIESISPNFPGYSDMVPSKKDESISTFIDQTSGLFAFEILSISSLARRESIDFNEITEAIRRYKIGVIENPWAKLEKGKIDNAEEKLSYRVKGQNRAIQKTADIIRRSVYNLSGSQYSRYSNRPKGVLFFAGPTGVGKTELAKALTELIFGSDTSYIRFDMTEFKHDHADQRLVGSPPGYVGYDVGGELTNKIKQNPFSVVLFDEIEKAHPRVLDMFMQMIDDGRLTSGRGETVYFSEALIIFTSNLGIYDINETGQMQEIVNYQMDYDEIEKKMKDSIDRHFKLKLNRPEILNRIGENFVVFDFIRSSVAKEIMNKMLNNVFGKLADSQKITVKISSPEIVEEIFAICCKDLSMGGRGIGNKLEEVIVNPLSRALNHINAKPNDSYNLTSVKETHDGWEVALIQT